MARRPLRHLTVAAALGLATAAGAPSLAGCADGGPTSTGTPSAPAVSSAGPARGTGTSGPPGPVDGATNDPAPVTGGTDGSVPPVTGPTSAAAGTPDATALAATAAWFSYDTRVDRRPNDTARRLALAWLVPALRGDVLAFAGDSAPGADWADWSARHAHATVVAALGGDDHPPDAADTAWRQVHATITLHGDAGWADTTTRTVFVRLQLLDGHWLVSDLRTVAPA